MQVMHPPPANETFVVTSSIAEQDGMIMFHSTHPDSPPDTEAIPEPKASYLEPANPNSTTCDFNGLTVLIRNATMPSPSPHHPERQGMEETTQPDVMLKTVTKGKHESTGHQEDDSTNFLTPNSHIINDKIIDDASIILTVRDPGEAEMASKGPTIDSASSRLNTSPVLQPTLDNISSAADRTAAIDGNGIESTKADLIGKNSLSSIEEVNTNCQGHRDGEDDKVQGNQALPEPQPHHDPDPAKRQFTTLNSSV